MENDLEWHYRWPDARDLEKALGELKDEKCEPCQSEMRDAFFETLEQTDGQ